MERTTVGVPWNLMNWNILSLSILVILWSSYSSGEISGSSVENLALQYTDDAIQDLVDRYESSDHYNFWHPNSFKSEIHSREVIRISNVTAYGKSGLYQNWKSARVGSKTIFVAMGTHSIEIFNEKLKLVGTVNTKDVLVALTTFSHWNDHLSTSELIIIVATARPSLRSYSFTSNTTIHLGTWPLHHSVKSLELCVVELSRKVIVIPESSQASVDIYNFESHSNSSQFWFFQRLRLTNRTCLAVKELDTGCRIAYSTTTSLSIWSFEPHLGMFHEQMNFQNISAPCKNLVPFKIAYSNYFALVPQDQSQSVEFYGETGKDKIYQRAPIFASEIMAAPVNEFKGEDMLIVNTPANETKIYAFDGPAMVFKEGYSCGQDTCFLRKLSSGTGAVVNGTTMFIAPTVSNTNFSVVLVIHTYAEEHVSPLFERFRRFYDHFRVLAERYKRFQLAKMRATAALDDSLTPSDANLITGNWKVKEIRSNETIINKPKQQLLNPNIRSANFLNIPLNPEDLNVTDQEIHERLNHLGRSIDAARMDVDQTVPRDSAEVIRVPARQIIRGDIRALHIRSQNAHVNRINGIGHIHGLLVNVATMVDAINIQGGLQVFGNLSINNLDAINLNDIPTRTFAKKSGPNVFLSPVNFYNGFTAGSVEATRVAGLRIPQDVVLASNVHGVTLENVNAGNQATLAEPVRGIAIDVGLKQKIFLQGEDQVVTSRINFDTITLRKGGNFTKLNGQDFVRLVTSIVARNHTGIIRGVKTAGNVSADSLTVTKSLNGTPFPHGFVPKDQENVTISGLKRIANLRADVVLISGTLNEKRTADMVTPHTPTLEHLHCNWTTHGPTIFSGDTRVNHTMGGVDISHFHFQDTLDQVKDHYYPNHNIRFEAPARVQRLDVTEHINGKSFNETFGEALKCRPGGNMTIKGITKFENGVTFNSLRVLSKKINETDLSEYLSRNSEQNITGDFVFKNSVRFSQLTALSLIDNVDLKEALRGAIRLDRDQSWPANLRFASVSALAGVVVDGPINGFTNFSQDVAVKAGRSHQVFLSTLQTDKLVAETLHADNLVVSGSINGFSIQDWLDKRISRTANVTVTQPVEILGDVMAKKNISAHSINGESLEFLWRNVLRTNRRQQVLKSPVVFYGTILSEGSVNVHTLNNYSFTDVVRSSVPIHSKRVQNITTTWHMEAAVFTNLTVLGKTCGVDLKLLVADSAKQGATNVSFLSPVTFTGRVLVKNKTLTDLLNDGTPFQGFFSLHGDQIVNNNLTWMSDVKVDSELDVRGLIKNVSLSQIKSRYSFINSTHVIHLPRVIFEPTLLTDHLIVNGLIKHRNFTEFLNFLVRVNGSEPQAVSGELKFMYPLISEGDVKTQSINGTSLSSLARSLVKKGENVTFHQPVCFKNQVETERFVVDAGDVNTVDPFVGQVSLAELVRDAIPISTEREIYVTELNLAQPVHVNGSLDGVTSVNGVPMDRLLTRGSNQRIHHLRAASVHLRQAELTVKGLFGGVNIEDIYNDTLLLDDANGIVRAEKNFSGTVTIRGNLRSNHSNLEQLVYLHRNETINSPVAFQDDLYVTNDMTFTGKWNNRSLNVVRTKSLSPNDTNEITKEWEFAGGLVLRQNATSHGLIDGVNATKLNAKVRGHAQQLVDGVTKEHGEFVKICDHFQLLYDEAAHSSLKFQSFDEHQKFSADQKVRHILPVRAGRSLYLLIATEPCGVSSFKWSAESEQFHDNNLALPGVSIDKWERFSADKFGLVVFSSVPSALCTGTGSSGLYFAIINDSGQYSLPQLISEERLIDFKIGRVNNSAALLILVRETSPQSVTAHFWDVKSKVFTVYATFNVSSTIAGISGVIIETGIARVFLQHGDEISQEIFQLSTKHVLGSVRENLDQMSPVQMKLFRADADLYAVVPAKLQPTQIKPGYSLKFFRVTTDGFELLQQLEMYDVVAVEIARVGSQKYVLVLTKPAGLYVYQFRGLAGLQQLSAHPLKFHGGEHLAVFHVTPWKYDTPLPFALVAQRQHITLLHSRVIGNAITDADLEAHVGAMC